MGATDDLKGALFASVGCLVGMLAVHQANKFVGARGYSYKVGCPPTGPLACLLFCMPKAPASQPKAMFLHLHGGGDLHLEAPAGLESQFS